MNESQEKGISRRGFLQLLGLGAAAGFGLSKGLDRLRAKHREAVNRPDGYREAEAGATLNLTVPGREDFSSVTIRYGRQTDLYSYKLQIRREGGRDVVRSFENGSEQVRKVGELTDLRIRKVVKNPDLPADVTIGVYVTGEPTVSLVNSERVNFPEDKKMYALKVITWAEDYLLDGKQPFEVNASPPGEGVNDLHKFGDGLLVGSLRPEGQGFVFQSLGYVNDSRALQEVG
jgi:hypothetical protein